MIYYVSADSLRRSASASSLDFHKAQSKDHISYQPSTSASFDASLRQVESHSNLSLRNDVGEEDPCTAFSKIEKEIENISQREYKSKVKPQSVSVYAQKKSKSSASTSTSFLLGSQELSLHMENIPVSLNPPVPVPRSQTPSPILSNRKELALLAENSRVERKKNSEIVRRPSIQKLKELFERPHNVIECPNGMRLSRSASSVTPRPNLSLHNDDTSSLKSKKKTIMGSDQSLSQLCRSKEDSIQYQICPPPPFNTYKSERDSASSLLSEKPQPIQNLSFLGVKRKVSQVAGDHSKEEKNKFMQTYQDERPALPIKKSKSFRWARSPVGQSNSPVTKNSEFLKERRRENYFSLDRGKENSSLREAQFENTIKKIGRDIFPPYQDGSKLSVYEASRTKAEQLTCVDHFDKAGSVNTKPQIPPKKSKKGKLLQVQIPLSQSTIHITESDSSLNPKELETPLSAPPNSSKSFENKEFWDNLQFPCLDKLHDDLLSENSLQPAQIIPENSKNSFRSNENIVSKISKDYVNAKVLSTYAGNDETPKVSYVPLPSKRESKEKNNHDYVNCSVFSNSNAKFSKAKHNTETNNPLYVDSILPNDKESKKNSRPSSDYEPVDFGETISSVDEVFETLNYGLIEKNNEKSKKELSQPRKNYYKNKKLDSLAIQVYQDCQAYLLHGNSQSVPPSLVPQTPCKEGIKSDSKSSNLRKEYPVPCLEEVKNKVSVPPQGLRNRERRNSYRQAVNTVSQIKSTDKQCTPKKTHKYEKIWFDTMKEELDENGSTKIDVGNLGSEYASNFNYHMNISAKETLFKDKLEELQGFVSNLENKKLPDLSEEELSSKDSGSTSSLLSRSAQSSRSSERVEPIYANALPGYRSSTSSSEITSKLPYYAVGTTASPYGSPYGTLATTTSYPYKQKVGFSHQNASSGDGVQSYCRPSNAATLPARTTTIASYQNIPPPRGFGSPHAHEDAAHSSFEQQKESGYCFPPLTKEQIAGSDSVSKESERNKKPKHSISKVSPLHEQNQPDKGESDQRKEEKSTKSSQLQKTSGNPSASYEESDALCDLSLKDYSGNPAIYYHIPSNLKSFSPSIDAAGMKKSKKEKSQMSSTPEPSTDNEDDLANYKTSSNSSNLLLRKLKGSKMVPSDATTCDSANRELKERNRREPLSPPGSPHSFSKAFGKLKMGSKSVAANFKSYLSSTKSSADNYYDGSEGSQRSHYPLQKSVSSGPSVNVFIQEVGDASLSSLAPKTSNNREIAHNFRCYDHTSSANEAKATRARQQYL
ncbi:hypothetical protein Avbf_06713 [Armadillidium vulgare]|nr:hypothetical protein Avbf_06713 [Armadillidium vulgare]